MTISLYQHPAQTRAQVIEAAQEAGYGREENASSGFMGAKSPPTHHHRTSSSNRRSKHNSSSLSRPRTVRHGSGNVIPPAPGSNQVRAPTPRPKSLPSQPVGSVLEEAASASSSDTTAVANTPARSPINAPRSQHEHDHSAHGQSHARDADDAEQGHGADDHDHSNGSNGKQPYSHDHENENGGHAHGSAGGHGHSHGAGGGHGHSHGSMNMRGVFLHVLGDA